MEYDGHVIVLFFPEKRGHKLLKISRIIIKRNYNK